jgi:hypothetical protein
VNLKNRVLKIEKIFQRRLKHTEDDQSAEHDDLTGDHLLRIWEGGPDAWVRVTIEHVIGKCEGLSQEAKASLQERLRILQTGTPQEILLVIAGLSSHCPEWSSAREGDVIDRALKGQPALARAAAECGILRDGRKDWRAFARWLERRFPQEYGRDRVPVEGPNRPKTIGTKFSLWAPDLSSPEDGSSCASDSRAPFISPPVDGSSNNEPP